MSGPIVQAVTKAINCDDGRAKPVFEKLWATFTDWPTLVLSKIYSHQWREAEIRTERQTDALHEPRRRAA